MKQMTFRKEIHNFSQIGLHYYKNMLSFMYKVKRGIVQMSEKMKKIKTFFQKEITIKRTYLLVLGVISIGLLVTYFSYALFTVSLEKQGVLNIAAGNLYPSLVSDALDENNRISVASGETKTFDITLENINSIDAKVNLYYNFQSGAGDTTVIGYLASSQDTPPDDNGYVIASYGNSYQKKITVGIQNNGTTPVVIEFGTKVGLQNAPLALPASSYSLALADISTATPSRCFAFDGAGTITNYFCGANATGDYPVITDVVFPEKIDNVTVRRIDNNAFNSQLKGDMGITSVEFSSGIETIGSFAFLKNQLTEVIIPDTIANIEYGAFTGNQLNYVRVRGKRSKDDFMDPIPAGGLFAIPQYDTYTDDDVAWYDISPYCFTVNADTGMLENFDNASPECAVSRVAIPWTANGILGTQVKVIAPYVFQGKGLQAVELPHSVEFISKGSFANNRINAVLFDEHVEEAHIQAIQSGAFATNALTKITLPKSLQNLESSAFIDNQLKTVIIKGKKSTTDFTTYGTNVFGWASGFSDANITFED